LIHRIFLDIETIPLQESWVLEHVTQTVRPPAAMKKAETIAKWEEEQKEHAVHEAYKKCALNGALAQVFCIGWAIDNEPVQVFYSSDESAVLEEFCAIFKGLLHTDTYTIVGHNVLNFDLRVLRQRLFVRKIQPPRMDLFPRTRYPDNVFDTMTAFCGYDPQARISLDLLAKVFGFEGKQGMDGSQVYDYYLAGMRQEIADYCKQDVEITRGVYERMSQFW
jgi:predicted PolB exonuclease-like 3'-5' exonuclease